MTTSRRENTAGTRSELERRLAALSPAKRALLERGAFAHAAKPAPHGEPPSVIPRRPADAPVPMSFVQELVWLLEQVNPGAVYNVSRVARFRGVLDAAALQRALDALVERHEVLRSTFDVVDGQPRQIVHAPRAVSIERFDLRSLPEAERAPSALATVRKLAERPFDLARDLQLRASVVQLAEDDQVLLLESHHVASDEWSRGILLRELALLYETERAGRVAELPALALQYGDYAAWQRETLSGARLGRLLDHWRGRLAGAPALLDLPTDRPRSTAPHFEGASVAVQVSSDTLERLRRVSSEHGVTLFMTLLAAFDVLIARWTGQQDIIVGSPIAGRTHAETHDVLGYFTNMLLLRTHLDADATFSELLARVRDVCLSAYEHQDLPYEKLVLELQRHDPASVPALQLGFTLQDPGRESFALAGLVAVPFGRLGGASKLDLSLAALEQPDGLRLLAEFRTDLFDTATVERLLARFTVLLESVARDPGQCVSRMDMLPADERETLLHTWNATSAAYPPDMCLHECIAAQAERSPDAIAVECDLPDGGMQRLTFAELHERAAILARYLHTLGVGPGVGVALCAERSLELVVGMLGILEAGGYYIPLDPDYPAERIARMLDDSAATVLVTVSGERATLPPSVSATVVRLGTEWDTIRAAAASAAPSPRRATASDLAYMIYTSGSTGVPKGVMIEHRSVVNYVTWMARTYQVGPRDAVLQKAPASFDACIWEFFLPLVTGARLVLARPGGHQDPAYLLEAIERCEVSLLQLVPSQLRMLLAVPESSSSRGLPRLRRLFLGGEALPSDLLTQLTETCPDIPVTNLYGPTETTVYSSHWDLAPGSWTAGSSVPIGRPIANTSIVLLDAAAQLVPIGVAGELCIGGAGLARGYWHRDDLTAAKFITPRFAGVSTAPFVGRLYRTGDRARHRADGTLEYLGRMDNQVKVRGFRIELGEIESALAAQPEVQSAAVLVREDTPGDQRIVAYCVAGTDVGNRSTVSRVLRERLKATLPAFMVPSAFVWLREWPLNANGKLDRASLPAPAAGDDFAAAVEYRAPDGPLEEIVASVWSEVLGLSRVGVEHDFFEIGGHSLLAMQVASRVSRLFGRRVTLRSIFQHPTVRAFAAALRSEESRPGHTDAVASALLKLRDMTPEERARRQAAAQSAAAAAVPPSTSAPMEKA